MAEPIRISAVDAEEWRRADLRGAAAMNAVSLAMMHGGRSIFTDSDRHALSVIEATLNAVACGSDHREIPPGSVPGELDGDRLGLERAVAASLSGEISGEVE